MTFLLLALAPVAVIAALGFGAAALLGALAAALLAIHVLLAGLEAAARAAPAVLRAGADAAAPIGVGETDPDHG